MRRSLCALAAAMLVAVPAGCGGEDSDTPAPDRPLDNPQRVPLSAIAGNPADYDRVTVVGTAYPLAELGFALAGDDAAVFVTMLPSEVAKVDAGETVNVQGHVSDIDAGLAERIAATLERTDGFDRSADPALESLSLEEGAPVIEEASLSGEQGGGGP